MAYFNGKEWVSSIPAATTTTKPKTTTTATKPKTTTTTTTPAATTPATTTPIVAATPAATATVTPAKSAATYNPQTGTGTFADGTTYEKYTWEPSKEDPTKLYRENAGTGNQIGNDYINAPKSNPTPAPIVVQPDPIPEIDPYEEMLAEQRRLQEQLAQAQRDARIAALQKARDEALIGLESERASIDPYYYDKRNQAAAQSDVGAMNYAQFMASRGVKGAAAGMPELYRNAALQSQIGRLDQQQAAELADIARRRSGIESAYQSDVASANADIDAQTMQNYINSMRDVYQQRVADMAAQGLTSTGEQTLAGRNAQNAELERQAALLAARYYDDIQAYINTLDPNDPLVPYLYAARRQKITDQAEQAAAAATAANEAQQAAWKNAFDLFKTTGRITSAEQAQILGLPMNATVADVDIARMNAQTSRMNAQTAATNANKSTANDPEKLYNTAVAQVDSSPYLYKDSDGKIVVTDKQGLRNYIIGLFPNDNAYDIYVDRLLTRYGLPTN